MKDAQNGQVNILFGMSMKIVPSDILCEFVEVVIHNILFARKLYPETIFSRKRSYGIAAYQCIQPDVNAYINQALKAVSFHAKKNQLKRIFICLHSGNSICEKYVFEVLDLKSVGDSDHLLIDLEQHMRNFILKLHSTLDYLEELNEYSTFSIRLQVTAYSNLEFNQDPSYEDFPWIEVNEIENFNEAADIIPIHSVESNVLKLQVFIEKNC